MTTRFRRQLLAVAVGSAALGAVLPAAAQKKDPVRLSRAELAARVAKTDAGLAVSPLPTGPNAVAIQVRREASGEVEVHDLQEDILIAQEGRATVVFGTATGARQTTPGEWRGGTITETARHELAPGDILWVPVGLAHQMLLPPGGSFNYLALKFPAKPHH